MFAGNDQVTQVQQATDLVALIGEQIRLRPKGREFVGICPFHDDSNPSLSVSPTKQIYKCFSCQAGGNAFTWLTNYHKMTFPEALRFLAERAGIQLERQRLAPQEDQGGDRQRLADANAKALDYFRWNLQDPQVGRIARTYLEHRGVSRAMVDQFQLGYAPDEWDRLARAVSEKGYDRLSFRQAGLIRPRSQGQGDYDRFRHRLVFPICDALGRPIAFGGRSLPDGKLTDHDEAKYLNSPETVLFNKSATLYGLDKAKKPIIDGSMAVVVEGYTDVIACHQAGISNVVATLGTALTAQHVTQLKRYAEKVVIVFDADEAGQKAADRAVEIFLSSTLDVAVAIFPDQEDATDPAELMATATGRQTWCDLVDSGIDALDYQFQRIESQFDEADTMAGRTAIAEDYIRRLAQMGLGRQGMIRRAMITSKLADLLRLKEHQVSAMIERVQRVAASPSRADRRLDGTAAEGGSQSGNDVINDGVTGPYNQKISDISIASGQSEHRIKALLMAEKQLIGGLLIRPDLFHATLGIGRTVDEAVPPSQMISTTARQLYQRMHDQLSDGQSLTLSSLLTELASQQQQELCNFATQAELEVEQMTAGDEQKLQGVVGEATKCLLAYHCEQTHQDTRTAANPAGTQDQGDDKLLKEVFEFRRANHSAARIARIET